MKAILSTLFALLVLVGGLHAGPREFVYVDFKVYDPVYVGIDRGFFEAHGLKVRLQGSVLAGPTGIQAVASGMAQGALSSIPAIINAVAAGLPVVGVTDIQSAIGKQPLETWYVLRNAPIYSVAGLRGKRLAINLVKSSFHYSILMALDQEKIGAGEVNFVLLPFAMQTQALLEGQVDMVGLMEPYASKLEQAHGDRVRRLFDAFDVFGQKQFSLIFVNSVWARDHEPEVRAFVAGIVDSVAWIEGHQAEAKKIIAKYTGIEEQFVPDYYFQQGARVVETDVRYWLDTMRRLGDLKAEWVVPEMVGTNRYR